jgi:hypothetical protein
MTHDLQTRVRVWQVPALGLSLEIFDPYNGHTMAYRFVDDSGGYIVRLEGEGYFGDMLEELVPNCLTFLCTFQEGAYYSPVELEWFNRGRPATILGLLDRGFNTRKAA